jgi:hypothetical protein
MAEKPILCADSSREAGEPLAGSATPYRVWLLLEYRPVWQAKAAKPGNNTIVDNATKHIHDALNAAPDSKMLFIRQQSRKDGPLSAFIVFSDETSPRTYRLTFDNYPDLLNLPLANMLNGQIDESLRHNEPLYTVCVHKERDRACGTYGWGVYSALTESVGGQVWQSTHIGGHRFAATLISFPRGTYYGHMNPDEVPALLSAEQNGAMYTRKVRGRACYPKPAQAAEVKLREQLGTHAYDALRHVETTETGEDAWQVTFADASGTHHTVNVTKQMSDFRVYSSTGNDTPDAVPIYNTTSYARS